jgi:hypothetical protein
MVTWVSGLDWNIDQGVGTCLQCFRVLWLSGLNKEVTSWVWSEKDKEGYPTQNGVQTQSGVSKAH